MSEVFQRQRILEGGINPHLGPSQQHVVAL